MKNSLWVQGLISMLSIATAIAAESTPAKTAPEKPKPNSNTNAAAPHPASNPGSRIMLKGAWVPSDPHTIDYAKLPKIPLQHVVVSDVSKQNGVNQHNYLIHHEGKFWVMWSDGPRVEDMVGQVVKYSTSVDGLKWEAPKFMTG